MIHFDLPQKENQIHLLENQTLEENFLELKPEMIMLDQQIETLLEYGEGCYPQVKRTLKSMLEELQNLPKI